jgi:hypothetical protein
MKLVGERRALAAIVFAFFFVMFTLNALMNSGGPFAKLLWGLSATYGIAFFALVAGYFWARWYAVGVGLFGVMLGVLGMWMGRNDPNVEMGQVMLQFGLHAVATLALWGEGMSLAYDGKSAWRERFHLDENGVRRLGRSVIRAGVSLPMVVAYAFAPRQSNVESFVILGLTLLGFSALVRLRTWGVFAIAGAGGMMLTLGMEHTQLQPILAGVMLLAAAAPFVTPMMRFARSSV